MARNKRHEMVLEGPRPSGSEEWSCPECGYRFVVRWPPHFERIVLEEGEPGVVHTGAKGDLQVHHVDMAPSADGTVDRLDAQAREWLDEIGIEWDGPAA